MLVSPSYWSPQSGWSQPLVLSREVGFVLYFASREVMEGMHKPLLELGACYPNAVLVGCSSAGEIFGPAVNEGGIAAAAVQFTSTQVRAAVVDCVTAEGSEVAGETLGKALLGPDLRYVLVLSDGLQVNGSRLIEGLRRVVPSGVSASGGLAGDGANFVSTWVGLGSEMATRRVVAVGFYGPALRISHGCAGGWQPFGPIRRITSAQGNVVFTLDDQPALALYRRYLGEQANGLPATGLLFPLQVLAAKDSPAGIVRTILAIDEKAQSLTFAGDVPQGCYARLMKAGSDALIDGAEAAGVQARGEQHENSLAILVSCVGRKLVLKQRVEEEVEAVLNALGPQTSGIGYYSYGELCPSAGNQISDLHNQTMTLTVLSEPTTVGTA